MATRMKQRRGTAAQWISTNAGNGPILEPGEIGFESDTGKFKIGDGANHWITLPYFLNEEDLGGSLGDYLTVDDLGQPLKAASLDADGKIPVEQLGNIIDGAPGLLDTLNELSAALGNDADFAANLTTTLGNKQDKVSGVSDTEIGYLANVTSDIQTQLNNKLASADLDEAAQEAVNSALVAGTGLDKSYDDNANTITLNIDSTVATKTYADDAEADAISAAALDATSKANAAQAAAELTASGALSTHASDTTSVHGIDDTAELATKAFAAELLTNATKTNITITGDKTGLTITAENGVADSTTSDLTEGTNLYFTDERAQDAVGNAVGAGLTYTDSTGAISVDTTAIQAKVSGVTDTEIGYLDGVTSSIQTQLNAKAPTESPIFTGTVSGVTKAHVGLGNVDNTTDANKPVSTATQTALDAKAPLASPTFTGTATANDLIVDGDFTVNGTNFSASATSITIEDNLVQLAHQNAANTVDLGIVVGYTDGTAKHAGIVRDVSDAKWKLFKGVSTEPTTTVAFGEGSLDDLQVAGFEATSATIGDVSNTELQYLNGVTAAVQTQIDSKAPIANPTFTGTVSGITKTMVGLGNVDNTSDANKPVSTAAQTALDLKAPLSSPTFTGTVSGVTKTHVGLGNVDNTADTAKPVSTAQQTALDLKANLASPTFTGTVTIPTGGVITTPLLTLSATSSTTNGRVAWDQTNDKILVGDGTSAIEFAPSTLLTNAQTASYTIALSDKDKLVELSVAGANNLTVPLDSSVNFPVGSQINILQTGTGQTTVVATGGVTINATPGLKLRAQWSSATLIKRAANNWVLIGDLSA